MRRLWRLLAAALPATLTSAACVTDHDALAKRPPGSGGSAGAGAVDSGADGGGASGTGGGSLEGGKDVVVEPPGDSELTFVHGVVDAETVALCFARHDDGGTQVVGDPNPKNGLAYGASLALSSIPGLDLAADDVQPFVVAADASLLAGLDCASALALASAPPADAGASDAGGDAAPPDPPVRAQGLGLIPKGTLSGGYSYLLVAAGCMGAPSHTDALEESVCGSGYSPASPTLSPIVVQMSRTTKPDKLGLQLVHASLATEGVDLRSLPPQNTSLSPISVVYGVVPGAIEPRPPNLSHPAGLYGSPIGSSALEVSSSSGPTVSLTLSWQSVLAAGGVASIADGQTYALVLLGPRISVGQVGWWNPSLITLVPTDP